MRWASSLAIVAVVLIAIAAVQTAASEMESEDVAGARAVSSGAVDVSDTVGSDADSDAGAAANEGADEGKDKDKKHKRQKRKHHRSHKHKRKAKRPPYVGGDALFNRAMDVRGVMAAGSLIAQNATVKGTLIARQLKTKHIRAHTMSVGELKTTRLTSPTGTIVVEGDLLITHSRALEFGPGHKRNATHGHHHRKGKVKDSAAHSAKGASFLAEEIVIGGVAQWALVRSDHFQSADEAEGWRLAASGEAVPTSTCATATAMSAADRFLGGHCVLANGPMRKEFAHLPPHKQVRVSGRFHFIDNWRGETAFMQIDGAFAWTQSHSIGTGTGTGNGLQMCGSDRFAESRMSSPIDVVLTHDANAISVAFGVHSAASGTVRSLSDEHTAACERSFGVDDIAIYVR